jgi:hypothetical protein
VYPPTIAMRTYFSTYHLWSALRAADRTRHIENGHSGRASFDFEHRAAVISAVVGAVAFLEAAVNECFKDASDAHGLDDDGLPFGRRRVDCPRHGHVVARHRRVAGPESAEQMGAAPAVRTGNAIRSWFRAVPGRKPAHTPAQYIGALRARDGRLRPGAPDRGATAREVRRQPTHEWLAELVVAGSLSRSWLCRMGDDLSPRACQPRLRRRGHPAELPTDCRWRMGGAAADDGPLMTSVTHSAPRLLT